MNLPLHHILYKGVDEMRYGEISGKEIININSGARLGMLGQTDLQIDKTTGEIKYLIVPNYSWFGFKKSDQQLAVPWHCIKKIGKDIILIDFED